MIPKKGSGNIIVTLPIPILATAPTAIRTDASVIRLELFVLGRRLGWIIQPAYNIIERLPHLRIINNLLFISVSLPKYGERGFG
jgi:hypothetical protein